MVQRGEVSGGARGEGVSGTCEEARRDDCIYHAATGVDADGTLRNLARLNYPYDPHQDLLLMDGGWPNHDKRETIGAKHRILLIVSDSLGDFMHDTAQDASVRREMAAQYADNWGLKWFLIPNPMYGHWEYSFQQYDYDLDRATRIQNKLQALDPEVDNSPVSGAKP